MHLVDVDTEVSGKLGESPHPILDTRGRRVDGDFCLEDPHRVWRLSGRADDIGRRLDTRGGGSCKPPGDLVEATASSATVLGRLTTRRERALLGRGECCEVSAEGCRKRQIVTPLADANDLSCIETGAAGYIIHGLASYARSPAVSNVLIKRRR